MTTEELAARQQAALDKALSLRASVLALKLANTEAAAALAALQDEVTRLRGDTVQLPIVQARLTEAVASLDKSNGLLQELQDALLDESAPPAEPEAPSVPETDTPLTPEKAAEIEFAAGAAVAAEGGTLPDLATDAAKAGFASVAPAPVDPAPPADETQPAPPAE